MATHDRVQLAQAMYRAFANGDRARIERMLADDLTFSSPLDVGLDRAGYFERCWPGSGKRNNVDFVRLIESGDEVIVTYESEHEDGSRGRNTEVLTFRDDTVRAVEVYFGWNIPRPTVT